MMDLPIPKYPVESLQSNITFGDLQSMSFEEVSTWVDDMRLELKTIWDNGIPPYQGMDSNTIKDKFSKLKDFNTGVSFIEDELYPDYIGFIRNFSKIANGVNQFFPALLMSRIHGKSIYDYLSQDELKTEFKHTIVNKIRFDKMYLFSKYIISKNNNDIQQFIDWVDSRSGDIKFWIENWNFNTQNEKLNRMKLGKGDVEMLRNKGYIKTLNENNHDGFDDYEEQPEYYTIRYYDKTQKIFPKIFQVLRLGLNQVGTNFPPLTARWIYEKYLGTDVTEFNYKVYDSSSGWGGRLLGSLCSRKNIHYIGTDVNMSNKGCYEELGEYYNKCSGGTNTYEIHYEGSEVIHQNKEFMSQHTNDVDLIFTSPPYFDREGYSNDEEQSYLKFPNYDEWLSGFLERTLLTSYTLLKPENYCIINIADIKINKGKELIPLEQDTIRTAMKVGFTYEGKIGMCMTRAIGLNPTDGKNYWLDMKTQTTFKTEPILLFKKKIQWPWESDSNE